MNAKARERALRRDSDHADSIARALDALHHAVLESFVGALQGPSRKVEEALLASVQALSAWEKR